MRIRTQSEAPPILEIRNLSVAYRSSLGPIPAVRGVSLKIGAGETLSLAGETGSGKSTIALAMLGLLDRCDQSGDIIYRERRIQSSGGKEWKRIRSREIGIVFQDTRSTLNPALTVMDHLVETLRTHQALSKREAFAAAIELLQEVGFQEGEEKFHPFELSGGMCQRVGIALGICNSPRVLVADEPTSAVDLAIQTQMLDLLHRMKQRYGLAILLISHDLPLISKVSDRILVMYHGRIVESGRTEEVLAAPAHPYTRNLLQCQPSLLNHHEENPLAVIRGSIPSAGQEFPGCSFAPRCIWSKPHCQESAPDARVLSPTHVVACVSNTGDRPAIHNF